MMEAPKIGKVSFGRPRHPRGRVRNPIETRLKAAQESRSGLRLTKDEVEELLTLRRTWRAAPGPGKSITLAKDILGVAQDKAALLGKRPTKSTTDFVEAAVRLAHEVVGEVT